MSTRAEIASFEAGGRRVFVVRGVLLANQCEELADSIRAGDAHEIVLDITSVDLEDRALDVLARLVRESGRHIDIRGLRDRQIRLLQWLGTHPA